MKKGTLKSKAYSIIKKKIISMEFQPGEFLNETLLSEEIKVSRTPIREAIHRLETENLVRVLPKKGIYVTEININDVNDVYQVRELLEPHIISIYGVDIDKTNLCIIREQLKELNTLCTEEIKYKIDSDLHQVVMSVNRNKYFASTLENVFDQNQRVRIMTSRRNKERLEETRQEHIRIIEEILASDYNEAANAMLTHLVASRKAALRSMMR